MHGLDAGDDAGRATDVLESEHWPRAALDRAVILLHQLFRYFDCLTVMATPLSAIRPCMAAVLAPLMSIVIVSGISCSSMARSKKRRATDTQESYIRLRSRPQK